MRRLFGKREDSQAEPTASSVGKQVALRVLVALIVDVIKRALEEIGYPWF